VVRDIYKRWENLFGSQPTQSQQPQVTQGQEEDPNEWLSYLLTRSQMPAFFAPTGGDSFGTDPLAETLRRHSTVLQERRERDRKLQEALEADPQYPDQGQLNRPVKTAAQDRSSVSTRPSPADPQYPDQGQLNVPVKPGDGVMRWTGLAQQASDFHGVPLDVIQAIIDIESQGNPKAVGAYIEEDQSGALSLMQVRKGHFAQGEDPFDPATNINTGTRILANNFRIFGDWDIAAAAYFGAVDNGQIVDWSDANGVNGFEYVKRFNEARRRYTLRKGS
jgi:hypothetical protein